jgi:hypothetical protein
MIKKIILIFLFIFIFVSCKITNNIKDNSLTNKDEALDFSLKFIKTYFIDDCELYYGMISDSVFLIKNGKVLETKKYKEKFVDLKIKQ